MKSTSTKTFTARLNWDEITIKLKQIFTRLTGYDLMFQESRKDLDFQDTKKEPGYNISSAEI